MSFLKALGYITGGVAVSYLTLTALMQDPNKPYRGHLNVKDGISTKNIYTPTETSENTEDVDKKCLLDTDADYPLFHK